MEFASQVPNQNQENIRNFVIIAHIDHGKSTLADRMLELTGTVEKRKMREQFLDQMELEREKGITIKMQPVRMVYHPSSTNNELDANSRITNPAIRKFVKDSLFVDEYILNLIDTPGHVDFSYEVSRALACVEGAILLVDAGQGAQAQTIANLHLARAQNLVIIPVINKIDLPGISVDAVADELVALLGCKKEEILKVSGKTGEGVAKILEAVILKIPPPVEKRRIESELVLRSSALSPRVSASASRALIFDSHFDNFRGVIAHVRVFDGEFKSGDIMRALATGAAPEIMEVGYFAPALVSSDHIGTGEIGYIATGLKEPEAIRIGDTITKSQISNFKSQISEMEPLPGYREPKPMVFASVYPESSDDYEKLRDALKKIKLNDAALFFEPEASDALGRGFRVGFLGMLHMEIIGERIRREYGLDLIFTSPSVSYLVKFQNNSRSDEYVYSASRLPESQYISEIHEPWVKLEVITPQRFLGRVMELLQTIRGVYVSQEYFGHERAVIIYEAPLKDILLDFFDGLKSVTEGYGSLGYELTGYRKGDVARLDILIAGVREEAFSQVVPESRAYEEGKRMVEKLKELLPKQLFSVSLQAAIGGKILARETIPALKKNVTAKLYGGDRTRKMKLWKKQKKGKEKLKSAGSVEIPPDVFLKMLKK
jgi:GTP-binding protein LepA